MDHVLGAFYFPNNLSANGRVYIIYKGRVYITYFVIEEKKNKSKFEHIDSEIFCKFDE